MPDRPWYETPPPWQAHRPIDPFTQRLVASVIARHLRGMKPEPKPMPMLRIHLPAAITRITITDA